MQEKLFASPSAAGVAGNEAEANSRAKRELLQGTQSVHTDDHRDIDDCLEISEVDGFRITLDETTERSALEPNNVYHVISPAAVAAYAAARKLPPA